MQMLGDACAFSDRYHEAELAYRAHLQYAPRDTKTLQNLSSALIMLGQKEEASRAIQRWLDISPGDPAALKNLLDHFQNTWVTEDCARLPFFDTIEAFLAGREVQRAVFDRAAYAYHGLAMGRTLLRAGRVRSARRTRLEGSLARRTVHFAEGKELVVVEPRDYAAGRIQLVGSWGTLSDDPDSPHVHLAPIVKSGTCTGFRIGDTTTELDELERSLMGTGDDAQRITSWMEGMKRVGFLRLLREVDEGFVRPIVGARFPLERASEALELIDGRIAAR